MNKKKTIKALLERVSSLEEECGHLSRMVRALRDNKVDKREPIFKINDIVNAGVELLGVGGMVNIERPVKGLILTDRLPDYTYDIQVILNFEVTKIINVSEEDLIKYRDNPPEFRFYGML